MRMGKPSIAVMVAVVLMVLAAEAIAAVHEGSECICRFMYVNVYLCMDY